MDPDRLSRQLAFLLEVDKLKTISRQTLIADGSRREGDAEHCWHLALFAVVLAEYAPPEADLGRVLRMILVHDLVEIDAGDTYCYDADAVATQACRERAAADRIFALLPPDQAGPLRELWEEFEARRTPEARFAAALDRVQPVLLNYHTQGRAWRERDVSRSQVIARCGNIADASAALWAYVLGLIDEGAARGWLRVE
ncbi:MAG: HD domain-containing protein [Phycisphaerae bacterium]|nr:HD domain-containing protein [Tepidisphaeraceae bacterium]